MDYPLARRYDMVIFGDSPDPEVIVYSARTANLQADTLAVQLETKKLDDFINTVKMQLDYQNKDLLDKMIKKDAENEQAKYEQRMEETSSAAKQEIPDTVKKAMKRLAKLTHPDKTSDEELHELFKIGKVLELMHDREGIENLIKEAIKKKGTRNLLSTMKKRWEKARAENEAVNIRFLQTYNSPLVDIARMWYQNRNQANNMYRALLQGHLQGNKNENSEPAGKV